MQMFHNRPLSAGTRIFFRLFLICLFVLTLLFLYVNLDRWLKHRPANLIRSAESVMDRLAKAWLDEDGDAFLSLISDESVVYDARQLGLTSDAKAIRAMLANPDWWNHFDIGPGSYFVADDGRFAIYLSTFFSVWDASGLVPIAALYALDDQQLVYVYDYYGGAMSLTQPLPAIRSRKSLSNAATVELIDQSKQTVENWFRAYNERDPAAYLACYSDHAQHIELVRPDWRVLTKEALAIDIAARFPSAAFTAYLAAPYGSPLEDGYFVSADGHYAAAQGQYEDAGIDVVPMLVVLELTDGQIIREYLYMDVEMAP